MSSNATPERTIPHAVAWCREKRRDALRASIHLAVKLEWPKPQNPLPWINTFGAGIKPVTFHKWWAEEAEKVERQRLEKPSRIPPNTENGVEGK